MRSSKLQKFTINSDFPAIAQAGQVSTTISIPQGTSINGGGDPQKTGTTFTKDILLPPDAQFVRTTIRCSRYNVVAPAPIGSDFFESDSHWSTWIENIGDNKVRCYVNARQWSGASGYVATSDMDFTFYISGYRLP